jgi:hypothetical protein
LDYEIKYLDKFSPAEIELILKGSDVDQRDLLRYTLFDLILRDILTVDEVVKQASSKEKERELFYLSKMFYWYGEDEDDYIGNMLNQPHLNVFFTKRVWQYIFGGFTYSALGKKVRKEVLNEIADLEKLLSEYLLSFDIRSEKIVHPIAGNLAHLKNLDPRLSKIKNNRFLIEFEAFLNIDYTPKYATPRGGTLFRRPF